MPGYSTIGTSAAPRTFAIAAACFRKPVVTIAIARTPAVAAMFAARNTAGVQLPQAPTATMTESTRVAVNPPSSRSSTCSSLAPWMFPKISGPMISTPGN